MYDNECKVDGKVYHKIFQIDDPSSYVSEDIAYVVFETIYQQKEVKTIHVVSNEKDDNATIGRAFDAGMRVPDISVSRFHAKLEFKDENFFLSDNSSKFGTLLLMSRKPLVIDP